MIFQDPFSSLNPRMTVFDILTEALVHHSLISKDEQINETYRLMEEVGLDKKICIPLSS